MDMLCKVRFIFTKLLFSKYYFLINHEFFVVIHYTSTRHSLHFKVALHCSVYSGTFKTSPVVEALDFLVGRTITSLLSSM